MNRATIGGILQIGQKHMALTVAHAFFNSSQASRSDTESDFDSMDGSTSTIQSEDPPNPADLYEICVESFWPHNIINDAESIGIFRLRSAREEQTRDQTPDVYEIIWNFEKDWALVELRDHLPWATDIMDTQSSSYEELDPPPLDQVPSSRLLVAAGVSGSVEGMGLGTIGGFYLPWSDEEISVWSMEADIGESKILEPICLSDQ